MHTSIHEPVSKKQSNFITGAKDQIIIKASEITNKNKMERHCGRIPTNFGNTCEFFPVENGFKEGDMLTLNIFPRNRHTSINSFPHARWEDNAISKSLVLD